MIHFIRPCFFLLFLPLTYLCYQTLHYKIRSHAWRNICDPHLLPALFQQQTHQQPWATFSLLLSLAFGIIAATGPAWQRLSTPLFQSSTAKIILLDSSKNMLAADLPPDRFQRARFIAEDLLHESHITPISFIAYTSEPFVLSPLTDDANTISTLLPTLTTDTPPVGGQNLAAAIQEAEQLCKQAAFSHAELLIMTGTPPNEEAIHAAEKLAAQGFSLSILPMIKNTPPPAFQRFATVGHGELLPLADPEQWLNHAEHHQKNLKHIKASFPRWRDEGRWFILPALLFLLPAFQRGWLRRIQS